MTCPHCGATIEDDSTTCPECGANLAATTRRMGRKAIVIDAVLVVAALLFLGVIPALGVAAIALLWTAPNSMTKGARIAITIVLAAAIVALPIFAVLSGQATFTLF